MTPSGPGDWGPSARDGHGVRSRTALGLLLKVVNSIDAVAEGQAEKIEKHLDELEKQLESGAIPQDLRIKVAAARQRMIELGIKAAQAAIAAERDDSGDGVIEVRVVRDGRPK